MALLPYKNPEWKFLLPVVILVTVVTHFANPLKIYAPSRPPPKVNTTGNRNTDLPYIHPLNGTSGDLGGEMYYDPVITGTAFSFQNDTVYVVPSTRNVLTFQCEARYPIFWNLAHSKIHPSVYSAIRVFSTRKFEDPFDPSTFKYITVLTMSGPNSRLTGNYSCQCAARHEIRSNVYVFWEYGSVLINSRQNMTVSLNSVKEEINLPCQVTDPDYKPKLVKLAAVGTGNTKVTKGLIPPALHQTPKDEKLGLNDSILYSPTTGFTLKKLPSPLGTYKCSVDQNDYVIIQVLLKNVSKPSSATSFEQKYTFQYDEDSKQVRCCAKKSGKKPPKIFMMVCEHPSTCGLREFVSAETPGYYTWNQGRRRGSCSVLTLKNLHTGVIRCVGNNGFNVYREFIVPVRSDRILWNQKRNTTTYFRWEEIDPQEMISVRSTETQYYYHYADLGLGGIPRKLQNDLTVYSKQKIHLGCHMSRYYFASGNYWMVRWKNQTMTQLLDDTNTVVSGGGGLLNRRLYYDSPNQHSNMISFVADSEMESVMCFGPVWNSSVWIPKIHYLYVNESMSPLLAGGDVNETVHYTWYANETEKVLTCSASGAPSPIFHWEKDNATIVASSHNYYQFQPNVTEPNITTTTTPTPTTTRPTNGTTTVAPGVLPNSTFGDDGDDSDDNQKDGSNNNNKRKKKPKVILKQIHNSLRINRVSYSTQGVFRCVGTNFGGRVTKEFHITVLEAKSWSATIFFVISCVLTVGLMVGIVFLLRRLHKDRQEINQLSGGSAVNFQNGGAIRNNQRTGGGGGGGSSGIIGIGVGSSSSSAGISTSTSKYQQHHNEEDSFQNSISFDNGKMTNNLIDAF